MVLIPLIFSVGFILNTLRDFENKGYRSVSIQKGDILFEFKEGENFNQRNICNILRVKIDGFVKSPISVLRCISRQYC